MAKKRAAKKEPKSNRRAIEQYAHDDKHRPNNPPVGLVTPVTDPPETKRKKYAYDPHLDPQLVWAGKAERTSFDVPTVSLHVHERIDPKTIIRAVRSNGNGNGTAKGKPRQVFFPLAGDNEGWARLAKTLKAEIDEEKIEAYRGTVSLPFEPGEHRRVAVKIVDDRGIESLKLLPIPEPGG
jgi:hypothetical protein